MGGSNQDAVLQAIGNLQTTLNAKIDNLELTFTQKLQDTIAAEIGAIKTHFEAEISELTKRVKSLEDQPAQSFADAAKLPVDRKT